MPPLRHDDLSSASPVPTVVVTCPVCRHRFQNDLTVTARDGRPSPKPGVAGSSPVSPATHVLRSDTVSPATIPRSHDGETISDRFRIRATRVPRPIRYPGCGSGSSTHTRVPAPGAFQHEASTKCRNAVLQTAQAGGLIALRASETVVASLNSQLLAPVDSGRDFGGSCVSMLDDVRECFADHEIGQSDSQICVGWETNGIAVS